MLKDAYQQIEDTKLRIAALDEAMAHDKEIFLAAQKSAKTNEPTPDDIYTVGTVGTIVQLLRLADGTVKVLVEGRQRARVNGVRHGGIVIGDGRRARGR